jgi:protein-disulfide isomerase
VLLLALTLTLTAAPERGDPKAPVTVVQFGDLTAKQAAWIEPIVRRVIDQKKARFVYRHFMSAPRESYFRYVNETLICVQEQGKFWKVHERLIGILTSVYGPSGAIKDAPDLAAYEAAVTPEKLEAYAKEAGADPKALKACLASPLPKKVFEDDRNAANLSGSPSIFFFLVNGKVVLPDDLEAALAK